MGINRPRRLLPEKETYNCYRTHEELAEANRGLSHIEANLTACVVEDNVATQDGGAFSLYDSVLTDTDGQVQRNTAAAGGGAYLNDESSVVLIASNWATGAVGENAPDDIGCAQSSIGWLGVGVSVPCTGDLELYCDCI